MNETVLKFELQIVEGESSELIKLLEGCFKSDSDLTHKKNKKLNISSLKK